MQLGWALSGAAVQPLSAAERRLTLLVAGATGSVPDQYARRLAILLQPVLRTPVVVDNRPGANGILSVDTLLRAPADGHTLLMAGLNVLAIVPALKLNTSYDPLRDITPVALIANGYPAVIVPAGFDGRTLDDLAAQARARPAGLRVGVPGLGSVQHLAARQLHRRIGVPMHFVPYASAAQVMTDLAGGHIDMAIEYASASVPLLQSGRLRALAVLGTRRWPVLPDVATALEQGVPGIEAAAWLGVVARHGTPAARIAELNRAVNQVTADPGFAAWVEAIGSQVMRDAPDAFADRVRRELDRWTQLVATNDSSLR